MNVGVCARPPYRGSVRVALFGIVERVVCLVVVLQAWVLLLQAFLRLSKLVLFTQVVGIAAGWVEIYCTLYLRVRWAILDWIARVAENGPWDRLGTEYSVADSADNSCGGGGVE